MASPLDLLSSWREPLRADWRERAVELDALLKADPPDWSHRDLAARLRRLAGERLGDGERLKLRRIVKKIRAGGGLEQLPPLRVLILSDSTTSFLAADLEAAGPARNLMIEAVEADFGAAAAIAFNSNYDAPQGPFDAILLMLSAQFFLTPAALLDAAEEEARHDEALARLEGLCRAVGERFGRRVIVATLALSIESQPTSADAGLIGSPARLVRTLNARIHEGGRTGDWIVWDVDALAARVGTCVWFDPVRAHQAKVPCSLDASPIAADSLAALLAAQAGRSGRAIVLDLDNTLWGGVVADDGVEGLRLGSGSPEGEAFAAFQTFLLNLRRRGVVLAVCSKNLEMVAREPFERHPEMVLKPEHIAVFLADFGDKASNVAAAAKALDLDPASIVFVDDNPAERERVRSELPFTLTPEIGEDPAHFAGIIASSGFLEHLTLTPDDAIRAEAYRGRAAAAAEREAIGNYEDYLVSLAMTLRISPFSAVDRPRITQLIQKSNQFNLTTRRYDAPDIAAIEADEKRLSWAVRLKDRFTDHGIIGVVIVDAGTTEWTIDSWLMSCRALERGVEQALMNTLVERAKAAGAAAIHGVYRQTDRNLLVKDFLARLGFTQVSETQTETRYRLAPADYAPAAIFMEIDEGSAKTA